MKVSSFEAIAAALNREGVRYLVAGGLAVNAHGYVRLTHDVDLVVQLDPENILPAFAALAGLDYRPLVPVDIFVSDPFDFDAEYARALQAELSPGTVIRFVSIPTLIAMKELANRARDRDDIEHLRMILEEQRKR